MLHNYYAFYKRHKHTIRFIIISRMKEDKTKGKPKKKFKFSLFFDLYILKFIAKLYKKKLLNLKAGGYNNVKTHV